MSDYTDARLALKRDRQDAKLAKAALKRTADGNPRDTLDVTQLPTRYGPVDNDPANYEDNPNVGGLVEGRPWV